MIVLQYPGAWDSMKRSAGKQWWLLPVAFIGYCWACLCMRLGGKVPIVINGVKHHIPIKLIDWRKDKVIIYEDLDERYEMERAESIANNIM